MTRCAIAFLAAYLAFLFTFCKQGEKAGEHGSWLQYESGSCLEPGAGWETVDRIVLPGI